jgi:hypothetical protein
MRWKAMIAVCGIALAVTGCLPRTFVKKDPGPHDRGFRYYRPKPYLMVKPLEFVVKSNEGKTLSGSVEPNYVSIEQVMLPDFSEEYSIHIRSGLGVNNTKFELKDGWNLTSLNSELDSQFDENVKAVSELLKVPLSKTERGLTTGDQADPGSLTVPAQNVPFGLYEAVISCDNSGRKRLYGFRYVGFFPYAPCPMEVCGAEQEHCQSSPLYGLVYDRSLKAMVFKELAQLAHEPVSLPEPVATPDSKGQTPVPPKPAVGTGRQAPRDGDAPTGTTVPEPPEQSGVQLPGLDATSKASEALPRPLQRLRP